MFGVDRADCARLAAHDERDRRDACSCPDMALRAFVAKQSPVDQENLIEGDASPGRRLLRPLRENAVSQ